MAERQQYVHIAVGIEVIEMNAFVHGQVAHQRLPFDAPVFLEHHAFHRLGFFIITDVVHDKVSVQVTWV